MCAVAVGIRDPDTNTKFCLRWCVYDLFSSAFCHDGCVVLFAARGNRHHRAPDATGALTSHITQRAASLAIKLRSRYVIRSVLYVGIRGTHFCSL